jgi:hypothetical protein
MGSEAMAASRTAVDISAASARKPRLESSHERHVGGEMSLDVDDIEEDPPRRYGALMIGWVLCDEAKAPPTVRGLDCRRRTKLAVRNFMDRKVVCTVLKFHR